MSQSKFTAVFGFFLALSAPSVHAADPGRILVAPRNDIILECNLDGSNCFHLTGAVQAAGDPGGGDQDVSFARGPSIAQDGTIAFVAAYAPDGTCAATGKNGCEGTIFISDADGTNVRQITFVPPSDPCYSGDFSAVISPDGTMVAFISDRNCAYDSHGSPSSMYAVYVVNVDGSDLRQVTPFSYNSSGDPDSQGNMYTVAWSPDSKKLAFKGGAFGTFCGTYQGSPIWFLAVGTIGVDGSNQTYLACDSINAAGGAVALDWSPDGTLIADARDSIHFGEPAIRVTDLTGQGRYVKGLTLAQLGVQYSGGAYGGELCPPGSYLGGNYNCIHFSPDSTQLAYINNSPSDNPSFYGVSTIKLDGSGRVDGFNVGTTYGGNGLQSLGIWWAAGPALPPAAQITLAPDTVELWPGFSQQLIPTILDAGNNLIAHTARAYSVSTPYAPLCSIQIGPYGLAMFGSVNSGNLNTPLLSATNEGLASNAVPIKCWNEPPCTYALSKSSDNVPSSGGADSVTVTATPIPGHDGTTCPWNAESNDSWIEITSPFLGVGAGTNSVSFAAEATNGPARQGTLTIAGQTFTVNQTTLSGDVSITKTGLPSPATVGSNLTYTITVSNHGPDAATGVSTSDTLPAGTTFVSSSTTQGSCSGASTINCSLGTLAKGASATVTIVVTPTQTGVIGNTASVSANEPDPDMTNNSATAMTTVNPALTQLTSLSPAKLWVGQNGSVRKLTWDLEAEVFVNGNSVGTGQVSNVKAGSAAFSKAVLDTVSLALGAVTPVSSDASFSIVVSVRVSCAKRTTGVSSLARLWYNGRLVDSGKKKDAGSRFDATIGGTNNNYFLSSGSALATTAGASRQFVDVAVDDGSPCPGRPFTPFGTWSMTLP